MMPLSFSEKALGLFRESGARYLIATTYMRARNEPITLGEAKPINLTAPPFNLPAPYHTIFEDRDMNRALGVWLLSDLPRPSSPRTPGRIAGVMEKSKPLTGRWSSNRPLACIGPFISSSDK